MRDQEGRGGSLVSIDERGAVVLFDKGGSVRYSPERFDARLVVVTPRGSACVDHFVGSETLRCDSCGFDAAVELRRVLDSCPGCGSPGPRGECAHECTWLVCECGYEGDGDEHVVESVDVAGFAGGRISHVEYACGIVEHDEHDDVSAAR